MIDIYTHILPDAFSQELDRAATQLGSISGRVRSVGTLYDMDQRFRVMDAFPGYQQVVSLPNPALEDIVSAEAGTALAKVANDAMAELCARHPDRFVGFAATVCLHDIDGALAEIDRAIGQLGARGFQIFTNVAGEPLDLPKYRPVFAAAACHDLPIWLHPTRTSAATDYASEAKSRYEMWWCFGWPYETSVAMVRLVLSGVFDRHPGLKIVTHHGGGMIPFFDGRVGPGLSHLGSRTTEESYAGILPGLKRPHLDYFRDFFADTAMFGSDTGLHSALKFFGPEKIVFSTDAPFGPIKETLDAIDRLDLTPEGRQQVMSGNARKLLRLDA